MIAGSHASANENVLGYGGAPAAVSTLHLNVARRK